MRPTIGLIASLGLVASCAGDSVIQASDCTPDQIKCQGNVVVNCVNGQFVPGDDCTASGLLCVGNFGCKVCPPDSTFCCDDLNRAQFSCTPDLDILRCDTEGNSAAVDQTCNADMAEVCVPGESAVCDNACKVAAEHRSYVGCDYYAVDMDNYAGNEGNAAAQVFAFVLSNPSQLRAQVTVEINNALPGETPQVEMIRSFIIDPEALVTVDDLSPLEDREVDGSPPGTYNTGTATALTSNAIHIHSTAPLIAYQFNPFQRYDVFSNDASLLVPTTAVGSVDPGGGAAVGSAYSVIGWPQLLADTDNPDTDSNNNLPAELTIVGTTPGTTVTIQTTADIIGSPDVPATAAGGVIAVPLGPFDVLNLESNGFLQDFSGSQVSSDKPVLVFSGNECTDVPTWTTRFARQCCCDHLEEQLFPIQTFGEKFVAVQSPLRTKAIHDAGGDITPLPSENEYWRLLTTSEFANCTTNLPEPLNAVSLQAGSARTIEAKQDFVIDCSGPVVAAQFVASQQTVVGPNNNDKPAGDPAFMIVPPVEQYRKEYLFLVPDKYAFDYLLIAAPSNADVWLDDTLVGDFNAPDGRPYCERTNVGKVALDEPEPVDFDSIKCALSAPIVHPGLLPPENVDPGNQSNDGVHTLRSNKPVGLIVYGFDTFVSYGYPGGSDLAAINVH
jgi:IgGFc binding protein